MRRVRASAFALGVVAFAVSAAGCDQPRNALGTQASACFRAVAPARVAVHHRGTLIGVRKANTDRLAARLGPAAGVTATTACLVAYRGQFTAAEVDKPVGRPSGRYAVVAVDLRGDRVLATYLSEQEPVRFRHL